MQSHLEWCIFIPNEHCYFNFIRNEVFSFRMIKLHSEWFCHFHLRSKRSSFSSNRLRLGNFYHQVFEMIIFIWNELLFLGIIRNDPVISSIIWNDPGFRRIVEITEPRHTSGQQPTTQEGQWQIITSRRVLWQLFPQWVPRKVGLCLQLLWTRWIGQVWSKSVFSLLSWFSKSHPKLLSSSVLLLLGIMSSWLRSPVKKRP